MALWKRTYFMLMTALFLTALTQIAAIAGPLEDAKAAERRNDYQTALKIFRILVDQGNAEAQAELGVMYEVGQGGLKQDFAEAMRLYRRAADQGVPLAQYKIGQMYEWGNGVNKDTAEALKWYQKAADRGFAAAQRNIERMKKTN
jgi:TPR repeat protein